MTVAISTVHAASGTNDDGADRIRKRFEDATSRRIDAHGTIRHGARAEAISRLKKQQKYIETPLAEQPQWTSLGPRSTGGRVKSILIHPTDPNILYIGAAAGGVWKSTNAGGTWIPIMDDANGIATGSLCFHPENPDIIYVGTGEQVQNANTYLGAGLLRSTDAGVTWSTVGLTDVGSFSRVYVHPANPSIIMVSCMNTNGGVYRSEDGGSTWSRKLSGQVYDMSINPSNPNEWFVSLPDSGIYYTQDAGATWQQRINGISGSIGRISIQQSSMNEDVLFALIELDNLAHIYRSNNKGQVWTRQYVDGQGCFFSGSCSPSGSQGFYDNYIYISPHNDQVVFAGGIDIWRTTNGGSTWQNMTQGYGDGNGANAPHVDQHCLAIHPENANIVYAGNDGGMLRSTNGGVSWSVINDNLSITQFYSFDLDPTDRRRNFGGTQDNGTLGTFGQTEWDTMAGGDGMITIVDYGNPNRFYGNYPNGVIYRYQINPRQQRIVMDGVDDSEPAGWVAPLKMSPHDPATLYHGRRRMYLTNLSGDVWYPISDPMPNGLLVTAIEVSPADPTVVWAGSNGGDLLVTDTEGEEWTLLDRSQLANRYISDIAASYSNPRTAWIAYSSYSTKNVWKTTDLGETWTSLWDGMPDVPVSSIEVHPDDENIIFIGTDIGVFATFDGGKSWVEYGKGLPRSPVLDIKLSTTFGVVRVGTHGRGIWEAPLVTSAPSAPSITAPTGGDVFRGTLTTTLAWSGFSGRVRIEFSPNNGEQWIPVASSISASAYRWKVPNMPTILGRIRVTSEADDQVFAVSRSFSIVPIERGNVITQTAVPWVPYGLAHDGRDGLWTTSFYEPKLYKLNATTLTLIKSINIRGNVGDSLFTDMTMDRSTGEIYLHRLNGSDGAGAVVIVLDTNGNVLRQFASQARNYATGLELVNGNLIAAERDGLRRLYTMSKSDGSLISQVFNPYQKNYGPRCLAYDGSTTMYQTSTTFPSAGGALTECFVIGMSTSNLSTESRRQTLQNRDGVINARGIEIDPVDRNFWISDFGGNIYKITSFEFVPPPLVSNVEKGAEGAERTTISVAPNPVSSDAFVRVSPGEVDRAIVVDIVDGLGRVVATPYRGIQYATEEAAFRWTPHGLSPGAYNIVVTSNGRRLGATSTVIVRH